jgi:predicted TIM-barrel fold metal-dependent hydrolase
MIIDAHVHLSTYTGKGNNLRSCFIKMKQEMQNSGIDYAVIIPDNIENDPKIADIETARSIAGSDSRFFFLGSPQIIQERDGEEQKYEELLRNGSIKGLKLFPGHDPYYPTDERCHAYYRLCERFHAPIVFHTGENSDDATVSKFNDPKYIVEIAQRYPKLNIIITHYFWPKIEYCYNVTKNTPNIYFELAGVADPEVLEKSGGVEKMKTIISKTIHDRPNQVIFGTDWPLCSVDDHIGFVKSLGLSKKIEEKIFWKNVIQAYNLSLPSL